MASKKDSNQKSITMDQLRYLHSMEKQKFVQLKRRKRMGMNLLNENTMVKESIKELGKGSKESIIPIGAGIYVSGTVVPQSFKRTLPGNVVLPSTQEEIEKELSARDKIYTSDIAQLDNELLETRKNLSSMSALLKMNKKQAKKE